MVLGFFAVSVLVGWEVLPVAGLAGSRWVGGEVGMGEGWRREGRASCPHGGGRTLCCAMHAVARR